MATRAWQATTALLVALVALAVPIRTAWGAPQVRLTEIAVGDSGGVLLLPHPASHLAVRWVGAEDAAIAVRWASGAQWSEWHNVVLDHDLGDEKQEIRLSGLIGADDATAVEVDVDVPEDADVRHLEVVSIDTEHGPRALEVVTDADGTAHAAFDSGARVDQPEIVTRAEWGADESLRKEEPSFAPIDKMSVHHTVTPNNDPDPEATIRAIYAYHTQSNGWNDIGYNFLIDASGRVYEGRFARDYDGANPTGENKDGEGVIGAHTAGHNTGTVGIAVLGDYSDVPPPDDALRTLERMLAWEADRHDIDTLGRTTWSDGVSRPTVAGHRDAKATSCPGDELYDLLPSLRQTASDIVAAAHAAATNTGYWELGKDGHVYPFGEAEAAAGPVGSTPPPPPVVSIAPTPTGKGYWILSGNGRITPHGDAGFYGSTETLRLNAPVARLEPTASGDGYWVLASDGGIFSFGDAAFYGSTGAMKLNAPVVSMAATPSGHGYWLLGGDGGVFTFGDGAFYGSTGAMKLNAPVVSMAPHPSGGGYWLQAADGGIFSFGDVRFYGSVPGLRLSSTPRSVQIRVTPEGGGYYVLGVDGGIFTFGDARFFGAQPGLSGATSAVDLALYYVPPPPEPDEKPTALPVP